MKDFYFLSFIIFVCISYGNACYLTACQKKLTKDAKCNKKDETVQGTQEENCEKGEARFLCCPTVKPLDKNEEKAMELIPPEYDEMVESDEIPVLNEEDADDPEVGTEGGEITDGGKCMVTPCLSIYRKFRCPKGSMLFNSNYMQCPGPYIQYECCHFGHRKFDSIDQDPAIPKIGGNGKNRNLPDPDFLDYLDYGPADEKKLTGRQYKIQSGDCYWTRCKKRDTPKKKICKEGGKLFKTPETAFCPNPERRYFRCCYPPNAPRPPKDYLTIGNPGYT